MALALEVAIGYYLLLLVGCIGFLMLGVLIKYWEHLLGLTVSAVVALYVPGAAILFAIVGITWLVMVDRRRRASQMGRRPQAARAPGQSFPSARS